MIKLTLVLKRLIDTTDRWLMLDIMLDLTVHLAHDCNIWCWFYFGWMAR
jgi:hypothetical protein